MNSSHSLRVSEVKQETPNSVTVSFDIPDDLKEKFSFLAGQYITIKHIVDGKELRRAYSICSTAKSGVLRVGIKKVENGNFSVFANTQLKAGDILEVMTPDGRFILSPKVEHSKNYLAFAAGSGITPVLSIIQTALEEEESSTFSLVYGNRSKEEAMFYGELQDLQEKYSNRFSVQYVFSREDIYDSLFGRIDQSNVNYILKSKFDNISFDEFYLCGPEAMIDVVSSVLKSRQVSTEKIHFELFASDEVEEEAGPSDGNSEVTVILDDDTETFNMPQSKSILEAALGNKLDAPYSCQGGICSTCIARLVEGKAEMRKNQILTDEEIEEGLILTCQAHPTTPKIVVDYDDV